MHSIFSLIGVAMAAFVLQPAQAGAQEVRGPVPPLVVDVLNDLGIMLPPEPLMLPGERIMDHRRMPDAESRQRALADRLERADLEVESLDAQCEDVRCYLEIVLARSDDSAALAASLYEIETALADSSPCAYSYAAEFDGDRPVVRAETLCERPPLADP